MKQKNKSTHRLRTPKLTLREAREEDAKFIYEMMQNKAYRKHYLERLIFDSEEDALKNIKKFKRDSARKLGYYFIVLHQKEKIGILDIYKISKKDKKASLGYGIKQQEWGKGYGSEVCKLGVEFMKKKLKLHSAEATADPKNAASQRVLEKNGFTLLGIAKDYYYDRGKFIDRALYWKVL